MARILIIEDEPQMRHMIEQILLRAGHEVLAASDGGAGLDLFREQRPDLVITDILMPEVDGLETIRSLRREVPSPKIIAMSGGGETGKLQYLSEARKFGANIALSKPFEPAVLATEVERLLTVDD
jgi:DNA-binding response OmpR family regulator